MHLISVAGDNALMEKESLILTPILISSIAYTQKHVVCADLSNHPSIKEHTLHCISSAAATVSYIQSF